MSDRPTPETDALDCELHTPRVLQDRYSEMRDHAQKLEQERDEARELLASEKITRNHIIKRSVEVEQERDEAREECKFLWDERDQARGELAALKASIFKLQGITMPRGSTTGWINCGAIGGSK